MLSATNMNAVLLARFKSNPHYSTLKKKKKKCRFYMAHHMSTVGNLSCIIFLSYVELSINVN